MELTFHSDPAHPFYGTVTIDDLSLALSLVLANAEQRTRVLTCVFRVTVASENAFGANLPAMAGRYESSDNSVRFTPCFPFEPGLLYRATLDFCSVDHGFREVLALDFALPSAAATSATTVQEVYPTSDELPENLLRFYISFSGPMQRGLAQQEVEILGSDREPAPDVLYRAPVELWDRDMRQLTVLLDPGRLKRGVGPNRELGPPLRAGQEYTLSISAGLKDSLSRPLSQPFHKRFRVTEALREAISVDAWRLVTPAAGSSHSLVVEFPRPLDRALLRNTLALFFELAEVVQGEIDVSQEERRWSFTPVSPWKAGDYQVRISDSLEDICGNTITGAFDRPLRQNSQASHQREVRTLTFRIEG